MALDLFRLKKNLANVNKTNVLINKLKALSIYRFSRQEILSISLKTETSFLFYFFLWYINFRDSSAKIKYCNFYKYSWVLGHCSRLKISNA